MGKIEIEGMEFHAYHGCLERERSEGNLFTVDFSAEVDTDRAARSDRLKDTLDYGAVYDVVAMEMAEPSNLIENVAGRIVAALEKGFPQIERCSVRVSKRNPPVGGKAEWARVTLGFDRDGGRP